MGTVKRPYYRIIACDSRSSRNGKNIEILGTYDPSNLSVPKNSPQREEKGIVNLKTDRVEYWLKVGAQPTPTVKNLLKRLKILKKAA
jgi:small subunit ribosomal protein S16